MLRPILLVVALLVSVLASAPALATPPLGSLAWTIRPVTLVDGPGAGYRLRGEVAEAERVRVTRCQKLWCHINGGAVTGWLPMETLSFGTVPRGPFTGPRLGYAADGGGTVCLYEGANYTGRKICGKSGFVVPDLKHTGFDNSFSSVSVEGVASVTLCRDRFMQSYCQRISVSQPRLNGLLGNSASSLHVY